MANSEGLAVGPLAAITTCSLLLPLPLESAVHLVRSCTLTCFAANATSAAEPEREKVATRSPRSSSRWATANPSPRDPPDTIVVTSQTAAEGVSDSTVARPRLLTGPDRGPFIGQPAFAAPCPMDS